MTNETVTQAAESCRDIVVNIIRQHPHGLTVQELWRHLPVGDKVKLNALRQVMDDLEDDEVIEAEQYRTNAKVYFLFGHTPRVRVRVVPAALVAQTGLLPRSWAASLGGAPC